MDEELKHLEEDLNRAEDLIEFDGAWSLGSAIALVAIGKLLLRRERIFVTGTLSITEET